MNPISITNRVATIIGHGASAEDSLQEACKDIAVGLSAEIVSVYAVEKDCYRLAANFGFKESIVGKLTLNIGEGLVHRVIAKKKPLCLSEATSHQSFFYVRGLEEENYHGFSGVPIIHQRIAIGALIVQYKTGHDASLDEVALLETVAQQISQLVIKRPKSKPTVKKTAITQITGRGSTPGVFTGKVQLMLGEELFNLEDKPNGQGLTIERKRVKGAHAVAEEYYNKLLAKAETKEGQSILSAHLTMLSDPMLKRKEEDYLKKGYSADQSVCLAVRAIAETFQKISDPLLRQRAADILDLGHHMHQTLVKPYKEDAKKSEEQAHVIVASHPSPALLVELGKSMIGALVLIEESPYSHVIILAKSMAIPTVMISQNQFEAIRHAKILLVDGELGNLLINPESQLLEKYLNSHQAASLEDHDLGECITKDNEQVHLYINAAFPNEVKNIPTWIEGVGLYRTEFQYFLSPEFPSEDEQTENFITIFKNLDGQPATIRILDVGGDKNPPAMRFMHEDNPILGERSIRFLLRESKILFSQLRAMMRAQIETGADMRILIPMATVYEEVSRIRDHIYMVLRDLRKEGLKPVPPQLGVMIEVPSAISLIPKFARICDFFCVGTNDLLQYTMAADRGNSSIAYLYRWHHPSFLLTLESIVHQCDQIHRKVTICGEMASEPWGAMILLGLGFRHLSMDRSHMSRRHELLAQCSSKTLNRLLRRLLVCDTSLEILENLQIFLDGWHDINKDLRELLEKELGRMLNPGRL